MRLPTHHLLVGVGVCQYRLALPPNSQIHNVFHFSMLHKHLGPIHAPASSQLPPVSNDSIILPQPKSILDRRVIQKGKYRPKSEILVKWNGAPKKMQPGKMSGALQSLIPILPLRTRIFKGGDLLRANNKTKSSETWSSPLVDNSFLVNAIFFSNCGWKGFLVG